MTILLNNNSFKYETEATVKLFFPAERFTFLYEGSQADGDLIMTRLKKGRKYTYLYVYVRIGSKSLRKSSKLENSRISDSDCEFAICRLIFDLLCRITGKKSEWGLITGIRPVKKVNALIEQGFTKDEIYESFSQKYLISKKKMDIAYHTAITQLPLMPEFDKKRISIYVSIPFCPTRCTYCSFVSHSMDSAKKLMPEYISHLCRELEIVE